MKVMTMLVPLDGSPVAEAALPKAVELAKQSEAVKIVLVRAVDPATLPSGFSAAQVTAITHGRAA